MDYSAKLFREIAQDVQSFRLPVGEGRSQYELDQFYKNLPENLTMYFCSLVTGELICRSKLLKMLGLKEKPATYRALNELIHPDDKPLVYTIVKKTLEYCKLHGICFNSSLRLSYRIRDSSGYLPVTRTSFMVSPHEDQLPGMNCSLLQEFGFMNFEEPLQYAWIVNGKESIGHRCYVENSASIFFTPRQTEVISFIKKGLSYEEIAEKMSISKSTVKRHMADMFIQTKTHCRSDFMDYLAKRKFKC
jgi:DNA-binding CsgD family transcriptional regulator